MTKYSHSKLGTFQQCKYKYKLQYIDGVKSEIEGIEAFMGKLVHDVLEKLYKDLQFQKLNSKKELIDFYNKIWDENWHDNIVIVKKEYNKENYRKMGEKFISDYYDHYKPFDQRRVIAIETQDLMELNKGNQYHVRIDHLCCDKEGNYYICDYKTGSSLKAQGELDEDHQLAMYSLWVKENYPDAKSVKLVWYFLAFDKEMISERNDEQLKELKDEIEKLISEIERCEKFETSVSKLCDYCSYIKICPAWRHKFEIEEKKEFKDDDGVKLVDEYAKLEEAKKRMERVRGDIIDFSKQKGVSVIFGSFKKCSVREFDKIVLPDDKEGFVKLIKDKGKYEEFSMLNYYKLNSDVFKGKVDREIVKLIKKDKGYRVSLSKRNG